MLSKAIPTAESDKIDYGGGIITRQPRSLICGSPNRYPAAMEKIEKPSYRCKYLSYHIFERRQSITPVEKIKSLSPERSVG
jgi:hypothetical protein